MFRLALALAFATSASFASCTCTGPAGFEGAHDAGVSAGGEGEGVAGGEGEGGAGGEGEGATGEGEGEGAASGGEGEGAAGGGEGEGEGASSGGEGEGAAGGGEGEGASSGGEGEGEGGIADGSTVVIQVFAHDDCTVDTIPPSITVSAGTGFFATFENMPSSAEPVDIDKIDAFNQVPLVIGLDVGQTFADTIVEWCGAQFTGTFEFRISPCGDVDQHFLDVSCGG